jgi:hypothetical protein
METFSHNNVELHDYEMSLGADKVLCLKLGYVVVTTPALSEEVALICQCLVQLYYCSSEYRKQSFRTIGATELVPLLVQVFTACFTVKIETDKDNILLPVVQVLRVYAKLESAKSLLIRHNQGVWLGRALQYIVGCVEQRVEASDTFAEVLGLIKDLTFRSQVPAKEILLHLEGGILQRFLFWCCDSSIDSNSKLAEWFTAVVWNLVLDKSICNRLLHYEGNASLVIVKGLLEVLSVKQDVDDKQSALTIKTKRNATSAIGNILAHSANHASLFRHENTSCSLKIIPTLLLLVEQDTDSVVRRRAMRTIRCLASSTDRMIRECIEREDIVSFLVDTIARDVSLDDDNDRDMQIQACQTVHILMDGFHQTNWPRLETALLQRIETTTDSKLTMAACRCLVECVLKSPWKRGSSCFSEMFWKRLESTVSICPESHDCVAKLVLGLANLEATTGAASPLGQPSSLTSSTVANTLTLLLSQSGPNMEESRNNALEVVLILVQNESNKRPLAENEGLLSGLVNLCLLQPGLKNKDLAKKVILDLVPEL